jgi:hypothetical protein
MQVWGEDIQGSSLDLPGLEAGVAEAIANHAGAVRGRRDDRPRSQPAARRNDAYEAFWRGKAVFGDTARAVALYAEFLAADSMLVDHKSPRDLNCPPRQRRSTRDLMPPQRVADAEARSRRMRTRLAAQY